MAKSTAVAYFLWFFGGWFGLHHFYLERDRQAFLWWCSFGGFSGIGWLSDLFKIPAYVREANLEDAYLLKLAGLMQKSEKPPFSVCRILGQIGFGNILAYTTYKAVPEELIFGHYDLHWLHILAPFGAALGVYTVGNIGREKGPFLAALIGAYAAHYILAYAFEFPQLLLVSFVSSIVFRYFVQWDRRPPKKRKLCTRLSTLGCCGFIYLSLWGSSVYFNMEWTTEEGDQVKFRDAFALFKQYYDLHGWGTLWDDIARQTLDPMEELSALEVLNLPPNSTQTEITKRWRQLLRQHHPDKYRTPFEKSAAQEKFLEIKEAYEKISSFYSNR